MQYYTLNDLRFQTYKYYGSSPMFDSISYRVTKKYNADWYNMAIYKDRIRINHSAYRLPRKVLNIKIKI